MGQRQRLQAKKRGAKADNRRTKQSTADVLVESKNRNSRKRSGSRCIDRERDWYQWWQEMTRELFSKNGNGQALPQPKENCIGCRYWRRVRGSNTLYLCHYSEDTGHTKLKLDSRGEVVFPKTPCNFREEGESEKSPGRHRNDDLFPYRTKRRSKKPV